MAKRNKKQEVEESQEETTEFTYHTVAFTPVMNKERKEYDMYIIKLNIETNEVELEIEECDYSADHRAMSDLNLRIINEMNRQMKLRGKK